MSKYCDYNNDWCVGGFIDEWDEWDEWDEYIDKWNEYCFQLYLNLPNINFYKLCEDGSYTPFMITDENSLGYNFEEYYNNCDKIVIHNAKELECLQDLIKNYWHWYDINGQITSEGVWERTIIESKEIWKQIK